MQSPDARTRKSARAMRVIGWFLMLGLPASVLIYPPGILWGSVPLDYCLPSIGPDHPASPYNGLHPYFFMVAALYVSYGFLMVRGARDPVRNVALFDFGIVSSIVHGGIMIPQAFVYPNEHAHLWTDVPMLFAIAAACWTWYPERLARTRAA